MKRRVLTRVTALVLAVITIFSAMSVSITASAMDMENASKKAAKALIKTGVGKIPVIGSFASSALEPILSELFGIEGESDAILKKLDEISTKLDELKNTLDKDTQEILKTLNEVQRKEFNNSMTSLRTMVANNYKFLKEVEKSGSSEYTKAVLTAEMFDFAMNNAEELEVLTETLTEYVKGTEFKTADTENIYDYVYRVSCDGSVLGGEAAMKASGYINSINEIITASYKLVALVLGEKLFVSDNLNSIMTAAETDAELNAVLKTVSSENLAKYSVKVYRNYWSELLSSNYTKEFNSVYSLDNPDSTVSKYNRTVVDNWFSFIREVRFSSDSVKVTFVRLNSEINYTTPEKCGFKRSQWYLVGAIDMIKATTNSINSKVNAILTNDELQKLYSHIVDSKLLGTNENGTKLTLCEALKEYGFTFKTDRDGVKGSQIFACSASNAFNTLSSYTVGGMYATGMYTGFMGNSSSDSSVTVTYFHWFVVYNGYSEDGSTANNAIMIFEAA